MTTDQVMEQPKVEAQPIAENVPAPEVTVADAAVTPVPAEEVTPVEEKENHEDRRWKRLVREKIEAQIERDALKAAMERQQMAQAPIDAAPSREQFDSDLDYFEAARAYDRRHLENAFRTELAARQPEADVLTQKEREIVKEKPDYEDVVGDAKYAVSNFRHLYNFDPIKTSEHGAEVLYELAKDPKFADRIINHMPIEKAAYEIGKIEAAVIARKTTARPREAAVSKAPPPIRPLAAGGASAPATGHPDKLNDRTWWETYAMGKKPKP